MYAMLPSLVTSTTLSDVADVASSAVFYLVPSEALLTIKTILYIFAGFTILAFLWKLLKKDQASG